MFFVKQYILDPQRGIEFRETDRYSIIGDDYFGFLTKIQKKKLHFWGLQRFVLTIEITYGSFFWMKKIIKGRGLSPSIYIFFFFHTKWSTISFSSIFRIKLCKPQKYCYFLNQLLWKYFLKEAVSNGYLRLCQKNSELNVFFNFSRGDYSTFYFENQL